MALWRRAAQFLPCLLGTDRLCTLRVADLTRTSALSRTAAYAASSRRSFAAEGGGSSEALSTATQPAPTQASASTAPAAAGSSRPAAAPAPTPLQRREDAWPVWDWAWVVGKRPSRKPRIKRPQRHQWHFCNPLYDPNQPLPPKILTPHAPFNAREQDDREVYKRLFPHHRQRNDQVFREKYVQWIKQRDLDWRDAFQRGMAREAKDDKQKERRASERKRQEAWAEYKKKLFEAAVAAGPQAAQQYQVQQLSALLRAMKDEGHA